MADRGANSRLKGKLAGKVRLTLTFSLAILWSHMGRLYAAIKMSPDEEIAERNTSHHHVLMSTEWQWEFLHFLQSSLLVWQVSTQSQRAFALCPWMWASTMSDCVTPALGYVFSGQRNPTSVFSCRCLCHLHYIGCFHCSQCFADVAYAICTRLVSAPRSVQKIKFKNRNYKKINKKSKL